MAALSIWSKAGEDKAELFVCSYLFVRITNGSEILADGGGRNLKLKPRAEFCLKLVEIGCTVPSKVGLNELDEGSQRT